MLHSPPDVVVAQDATDAVMLPDEARAIVFIAAYRHANGAGPSWSHLHRAMGWDFGRRQARPAIPPRLYDLRRLRLVSWRRGEEGSLRAAPAAVAYALDMLRATP